ncbi:bile acid:sodium symporter family protein [Halopiger aswanensis]|uniref:BASS family bile acid:Na+ symporter/sodium/bile acid cotransporter 7 n=1 Tax=Halopiger aswanensis TaxID=148449 RepID=A0A419WDU9_9EURY|nr:bile acid:sodium symporter [Halopiger aswanensis]RKD93496.1 BASS family bile acid:Na+ symporter/sodium/bile acid cotransporter 7 [Halopiger aswanensis]
MDSLRTLLRSQRSLLVVLAATVAGVAVPHFAAPLQPIIPLLVAGLIFTSFYGFSLGEMTGRNASLPVLVSLAGLYLLTPLALYPIAAAVLSGEALLGVLIVLAAPLTAGSSIIWTRLSGGNTFLATVIALLSLCLSPLVMPSIVAAFAGSTVDIDAAGIVVELAAIVAGGGVLARLVPNGAVSDDRLDAFSLATMGVLIYAGVGASSSSIDIVQLAFVSGLAVAALGLSAGLAYALYARGARSDDCITVLFSSSMKNLSVSVMVGATVGSGAVIASITAFHVAQQLVSSSLVTRLASSGTARSSATVTAARADD